jgi:TetR/AcrR family transcriptional regulator
MGKPGKTTIIARPRAERRAAGYSTRQAPDGPVGAVSGHAQDQPPARAQDRSSTRTREKILNAALRQFGQLGLAGARTDAIAKAAGVNKALLYYYFKNKSSLYHATLNQVVSRTVESAVRSLDSGATPGESLLRLVLNHFDRIATQRPFQSLMQQEMVRFHRGESDVIPTLARSFYGPLLRKMEEVVREGIRTAELCDVDWMQILYAAMGANVFFFLSAPIMREAVPFEPFEPSALRDRRNAAIEFLGIALFRDRTHGAKVARKVLAETPMSKPAVKAKALLLGRRCS